MAVAEGRSWRVVPCTVIAGPPGRSVVPGARMYCEEGFAVIVVEPIVSGARMGVGVMVSAGL